MARSSTGIATRFASAKGRVLEKVFLLAVANRDVPVFLDLKDHEVGFFRRFFRYCPFRLLTAHRNLAEMEKFPRLLSNRGNVPLTVHSSTSSSGAFALSLYAAAVARHNYRWRNFLLQ